ncbi:MAG: DUF6033 family protein [Oscillospiraceae bacterium]|nr:DUF6033 family protein [Oscillospiraceae bacterium]
MNVLGITSTHTSPFNGTNTLNNNLLPGLDFQKIMSTAMQETGGFVSAEQSLREIYPGLKYHVADVSQFKYRERLDFPVHEFYKDTINMDYLNSWKPTVSSATGYEPNVQHSLGTIPKGLHSVLIHPKCQSKMDNDPEYAKKVVAKIKNHFETDVRINEAINPDSVKSISQAVYINEDGEIGYYHTVGDGPSAMQDEEAGGEVKREKVLNHSQHKPLPFILLQEQRTQQYLYDYLYGVSGLDNRDKRK